MDKKEIMSIWAAFQEVQEKKKAKLDPVGKEDGDVDNDGDEDSSDEYLANRRKKVGAAMKKEGTLPPALQKAIDKKKGKKVDDDDSDEKSDDSDEKSEKPKKGENPFAKKKDVKESEESPYPTLDKKKREKKGSNLEDAGGPAAKLKGEAVEKDKVECPKCKGKGCDHCDDKGTHVKEGYQDFIESLDNEELEAYVEWLMEEVTPADHLAGKLMKHKKKLQPAAYKKHHSNLMSKDPKKIKNSLDRLNAMESTQLDELSPELLNRASDKAKQKSDFHAKQSVKRDNTHDRIAKKHGSTARHSGASFKAKSAQNKNFSKAGDQYDKQRVRNNQANKFSDAAKKKSTSEAWEMISSVLESRQRDELERLLSPQELAAIEEKASGEEFMSTSSPKEKKVMADHKAGSEKKYEDWEDTSEKDASKAGRAVKSQSPVRRGESRKSESMGKVKGS